MRYNYSSLYSMEPHTLAIEPVVMGVNCMERVNTVQDKNILVDLTQTIVVMLMEVQKQNVAKERG